MFINTKGYQTALGEFLTIGTTLQGDDSVNISYLPGSVGLPIKKRLTDIQMMFLTNKYGVEFAQVYQLGQGKNGRGGKYYLFSGNNNSVIIPINSRIILINHTHPGGTAGPSARDLIVMELLSAAGSPQKVSSILPIGKDVVKFTKKGIQNND
ncbi:MAG: hypothetical protein IJM53_05510 [Lachnospiraceae bacterium]|nr:hypothetical protein [Lachnospiraceae bacterium]